MQVQIGTDSNIEGGNALTQKYEVVVRDGLDRFSEQITRVAVHLSDENSGSKFGVRDKRCLMEVRIAGRQPLAVSHQAPTLDQAVDGAVERMTRSLDGVLKRL